MVIANICSCARRTHNILITLPKQMRESHVLKNVMIMCNMRTYQLCYALLDLDDSDIENLIIGDFESVSEYRRNIENQIKMLPKDIIEHFAYIGVTDMSELFDLWDIGKMALCDIYNVLNDMEKINALLYELYIDIEHSLCINYLIDSENSGILIEHPIPPSHLIVKVDVQFNIKEIIYCVDDEKAYYLYTSRSGLSVPI